MKICIIGRHGYIGSKLARHYQNLGHEVSSTPTPDTSILFHLGSPTHPPFNISPEYHMQEVLNSFLYLLPFCKQNSILFVYASSALVYEDQNTAFTRSKQIMELMAGLYPQTLGLRIFPVYGEENDRAQKTVIYQWCQQIKQRKRPVVFGDGTQQRDFIYIRDVISQIDELIKHHITGVHDVGRGHLTSFNEIIEQINEVLETDIQPIYKPAPEGYPTGIECQDPLKTYFSTYDGIKEILG